MGRSSRNPKDDAKLLGEMASGILGRLAKGKNAHQPDYVQSRVEAAGLPPIDDNVDVHMVGEKISVALAAHYLRSAVALVDRYDLDQGHRALPIENWRRHLDRLLGELGLSGPGSSPGQGGFPRQFPTLTATSNTHQSPSVPAATTPSSAKLFSEVARECLDDRIASGQVKSSVRHHSAASIRIWLEVIGDKPVDQIGRPDMYAFRSVLIQLPKHYWRSKKAQEKPILTVIAEAKAKAKAEEQDKAKAGKKEEKGTSKADYVRVGPVTVNKHLSMISPIFEWCQNSGDLPENGERFWTRLHLKTGKKVTGLKKNQQRPAFTHAQIKKIFEHPVWTGRKSDYYYNAPGSVIIRDSLYWCPLIAAYTGLRREEFSQLTVGHVVQVEGVWIFDLYRAGLNLKTFSSPRNVPLHKELLALGFIEALREGRDDSEQLFPELTPEEEDGKFGDPVGDRFARVLQNLKIVIIRRNGTKADGVFHPFRHRLITDLVSLGVPEGVIDSVTGHDSVERESERARYTGEIPVAILKKAIDKLELPIDIKALDLDWHRCRA